MKAELACQTAVLLLSIGNLLAQWGEGGLDLGGAQALLACMPQQFQQLQHQGMVGGYGSVALQHLRRWLYDRAIVAYGAGSFLCQLGVACIQACDQQQAGGVGIQTQQGEIRTMFSQ